MTSAAAPARRRPPGRYDEPSRVTQRLIAVLLSVLAVGLVAAVTWSLYSRYGSTSIEVRVRGYSVLSDRAVRVEFEVTPPDDRTAYCLVRAQDRTFAEVGHVVVPVAGTDGRRVRVQQELTTTARAVTGDVPVCRSQRPSDEPLAPTAQPVAP